MTKVAQCQQCGAGMSSPANTDTGERTCVYCGSVLREKSLPEQAYDQHRFISSKHCPRCHHKTVETETMGCHLRSCHHCGGLWVPIVALRKIGKMPRDAYVHLTQLNKSKLQRKPQQARSRHGALKCPACAKPMTQHVYAKGTMVAVEVCRKHGAWFDENELVIAHRGVARRLGLNIEPESHRDNDLDLDVSGIESRVLLTALIAMVAIIVKVLE